MLLALLPNTLKTMELIDGKATAAAIKKEIAEEVEQLVANGQKRCLLYTSDAADE